MTWGFVARRKNWLTTYSGDCKHRAVCPAVAAKVLEGLSAKVTALQLKPLRKRSGIILHMIETMKPGTGRMAVVVPHVVLFRGAAEGRIRQKLIDENLLDVVIGLPEKLFYDTGIPAAVLVFRKNKAGDKVLFIDASHDFEAGKNQNLPRETDLQRIRNTAASRKSVVK